jgi:hypothetical protein
MRHLTLIATIAALALAVTPAFAGKGGNGNGNGPGNRETGSCSVDGNVVTGTGLPDWTLMNFMVTDASGTTGWVIGFTDDGTRSIDVPDRKGPTTYEFVSETRGHDGSRYDVFATCSA